MGHSTIVKEASPSIEDRRAVSAPLLKATPTVTSDNTKQAASQSATPKTTPDAQKTLTQENKGTRVPSNETDSACSNMTSESSSSNSGHSSNFWTQPSERERKVGCVNNQRQVPRPVVIRGVPVNNGFINNRLPPLEVGIQAQPMRASQQVAARPTAQVPIPLMPHAMSRFPPGYQQPMVMQVHQQPQRCQSPQPYGQPVAYSRPSHPMSTPVMAPVYAHASCPPPPGYQLIPPKPPVQQQFLTQQQAFGQQQPFGGHRLTNSIMVLNDPQGHNQSWRNNSRGNRKPSNAPVGRKGWERQQRDDPLHGPIYIRNVPRKSSTQGSAASRLAKSVGLSTSPAQTTPAGSFGGQTTPTRVSDTSANDTPGSVVKGTPPTISLSGCKNYNRSGFDITYEACVCRRCEPKNRSIYVAGFEETLQAEDKQSLRTVKDYFEQFGHVEDVHAKKIGGHFAFVR